MSSTYISFPPPNVLSILQKGLKPQLQEVDQKAIAEHFPQEIIDLLAAKGELIACNKRDKDLQATYQVTGSFHSIKVETHSSTAFISVFQHNPKSRHGQIDFTGFTVEWEKGHCRHDAYRNYCKKQCLLPTHLVDAISIECFKKQLAHLGNGDLNWGNFMAETLAEFARDRKIDTALLDMDFLRTSLDEAQEKKSI